MITDFAITSIDVPDRLDVQEVRDRAEADHDSPHTDRNFAGAIRIWAIWIAVATAVFLVAYLAFRSVAPLWSQVSAAGLSEKLSLVTGWPVKVASSGIRLTPAPRLVIEGIDVAPDCRIESVSLRFSWTSLAKAIQGGGWVWGEATVGPLELSPEAAFALIRAAPSLSLAVPAPITSMHFESVRFPGAAILPARYQITVERASGRPFSTLTMTEIGSAGRMELGVAIAFPEPSSFRLRAYQWRPPFGPAQEWNEISAEGSFAPARLQIDSYSASGFLGVLTGSLLATKAATDWSVRGTVRGTNIDLASIQREIRKRSKLPAETKRGFALQGVMESTGTLAGQGVSLAEALDRLSATGRAQVRFAALNGINLGANAIQSGPLNGQGGATRFGDLEATIAASSGTVRIKDIHATAGALQVKGAVGIERSLVLGGILRAEMSSGGVAPVDVRVSGTVFEPVFEN